MANWLRWLLVPVSPLIVLAAIVLLGRLTVSIAEGRCAESFTAGGLCVEPYMTSVMDFVVHAGIVLAAAGIVLSAAWFAPRWKRVIAIVGCLPVPVVLIFAYASTLWPDLFMPALLAVASGALSVAWVWFKQKEAV